jgi:hypothetical protein
MKIKEESLLNIVNEKSYVNHHVSYIMKAMSIDEKNKDIYISKMMLFGEGINWRRLVFSEKSKKNLDNYTIPKDIRVDVLKSLPNRKDIILIDEHNCIKYIKTDKELIVSFHYTNKTHINNYNSPVVYMFHFRVDLITGDVSSDNLDFESNTVTSTEMLIEKFYSRFLVVVTYLELTEVTLNIIEGGRSFGTWNSGKIKNETKNRIIMVNTNWNTETISLNSFSVRGHWRLQSCGVGRSQFKYVYIKPYEKGLIRRLPQKELV